MNNDEEVPSGEAAVGETEAAAGNGDGDDEQAETEEQVREEEPEKRDEISQRILNIMANFLEGEVRACPMLV